MKHFLDLLESYNKLSCCVSRINEEEQASEPDYYGEVGGLYQTFAGMIDAGEQVSPGGNTINVSPDNLRAATKGIVVKVGGTTIGLTPDGSAYRVRDGARISTRIIKEFHSKYFGKAGAPAPETVDAGQQGVDPQVGQTPLTPYQQEKLEKINEIEKTKAELSEKLLRLAEKILDEASPIQVCKIEVGGAIASTRRKRDYLPQQQVIADRAYAAFNEGKYCEAKAILQEDARLGKLVLDTRQKILNRLTESSQYGVLQQLAELSNLTTAEVKDFFFNEECPRNVKRSDCVSLTDKALIAENPQFQQALNNFNEFIDFLLKGEDPKDPLELARYRNLVRFTEQGDMIIQGESLGRGIAVKDRGRIMYDFLSLAFKRVAGKDKSVIVYDLRKTSNGGDISVRGLVFEHMFPLLGIIRSRAKALLEKNVEVAKKLGDTLNRYIGGIDKICRFLQSFREYVQGYENNQFAVKEEDLQSFGTMREELTSLGECQDLSPVLEGALFRAAQRYSVMNPDFAVQVGKETTDGTREDIMYCYNSLEEAQKAARRSNLRDVQEMTIKEVLDLAPDYAKAFPKELLGDKNRKIAVVREGLKLSTNNKTRLGSASIAKQIGLFLAGVKLNKNQRDWRDRSRENLGISKSSYSAINAIQAEFAAKYQKTEAQIGKITKIQKVKKKDGTVVSESGVSTIDNLIQQRKRKLSAQEAVNDEVLSSFENLRKVLDKKNPNQAEVESARQDLMKSIKTAQTKEFIADGLKRNKDGSFVDSTKAAAVADFLVRSGSTNSNMATSVVHLDKGKGTQTIDHNRAVAGLMRDALAGDQSVSIELPDPDRDDISVGGAFSIKVRKIRPDGRTISVTYEFDRSNMVAVVNQTALDEYQVYDNLSEGINTEVAEKLQKLFTFLIEKLQTNKRLL